MLASAICTHEQPVGRRSQLMRRQSPAGSFIAVRYLPPGLSTYSDERPPAGNRSDRLSSAAAIGVLAKARCGANLSADTIHFISAQSAGDLRPATADCHCCGFVMKCSFDTTIEWPGIRQRGFHCAAVPIAVDCYRWWRYTQAIAGASRPVVRPVKSRLYLNCCALVPAYATIRY